jgi:hypothetical protein
MAQSKKRWQTSTAFLYGKSVTVNYKAIDALWYSSAGTKMLRIVVVRDPKGKRKDDCFFSTDLTIRPEAILEAYALRWSLEVAFRDSKQFLGFERSQCWTRKAVERTAPFAFVTYAIVVLWFAQEGHQLYPQVIKLVPWYRHKRGPSFADMHQTARYALLRQELFETPTKTGGKPKLTEHAESVLRLAA